MAQSTLTEGRRSAPDESLTGACGGAAAPPGDLLPNLSRAFEHATGWRLDYRPRSTERRDSAAGEVPLWTRNIEDGQDVAGELLLTPSASPRTTPLPQALNLAEQLAELFSTLARTTRRLEHQNNSLSTLVHLGLAIPGQENLAWALTQALRAAVQLTNSRSAAFFLLDPELQRLKLRGIFQIPPEQIPFIQRELSSSWADVAALTRGHCELMPQDVRAAAWLPADARTALCTAVQSETMPIGTLWVYDRRTRAFSDRDRHVLQSVATQIAAVLERVALLRKSESQDRISRELQHASDSQPILAPGDLPRDPRFEVAARCTSCYELGGDLCEVIAISPDQCVLSVGDASGNSIPAAMIMAAARGALRAHPGDRGSILETVGRLNRALVSITRSHQFMSLCHGVFDAGRRQWEYCNAGHPVPFLIRGDKALPLESHGLLLGILRDATYDTSVVDLEPHDLIVLYSDGLSEARSASQRMFRAEGIAASLLKHAHGSADDVLNGLWREVDEHIAGGPPGDDRSLLVLRVLK